MPSRKQPYLLGFGGLEKKDFGGVNLRGNAREQRPIAVKRTMHLVMRSSHAVGEKSFLRTIRARKIHDLVHRLGRKHRVRVYRFANVGNHLHLLVMPKSRAAFKAFVRAIAGVIARITLGAQRGHAQGQKFWDARPFTRIVEWGRDFKIACQYILQNRLEVLGFIPYQPRKNKGPPGRARPL
jgi:REP element-mobilizing transposase RayT